MTAYGDKFRKANAQPFERTPEITEEHRRALHRLIGTEGFARVDTHCNKHCRQGRDCDCPNGLADEAKLYDTPTRWERIKAGVSSWWRRHICDEMEDHP